MLFSLNQFISSITNNLLGRYLFAIITGLLLSLTLNCFGLGFYTWFALIPLFILVKSSNSYVSACVEALVFLFVYNLISFIWVLGIHPLTWQGFSQLESVLISLSGWLAPSIAHSLILIPFIIVTKIFYDFRTSDRSSELKILDVSILSFLWVVIEHKLIFNLGDNLGSFFVPINLLAYSQADNSLLVQSANIWGAIGIEILIIFTNLLLSNFFNIQRFDIVSYGSRFNVKQPFFGNDKAKDNVQAVSLTIILILSIYIYGFLQLQEGGQKRIELAKKAKDFALIQADYSASTYRSANASMSSKKLLDLQMQISSNINEDLDLLLWSEGSVPTLSKNAFFENYVKELGKTNKVFGFGTFHSENGKVFNSAEFFEAVYEKPKVDNHIEITTKEEAETNGEVMLEYQVAEINSYRNSRYNKVQLVPYGEYTPFVNLLPGSLKSLAQSVIGTGFDQAKLDQEIVKTETFNIANSICFELLFPQIIREQVVKGGEVIINFNDLSWFKSPLTLISKQANLDENFFAANWLKKMFLASAVFRAVENKRDLILVSNAGYSALIGADGKILAKGPANKIHMLRNKFTPRRDKSIYTLYGW